jgi:hypothetical protein
LSKSIAAQLNTSTFPTAHILATAAPAGALALAVAVWRLRSRSHAEQLAVGVLTFAATALLRLSANMPALNDDGIKEFSANDCLAPVATWVFLAVYADLRQPGDRARFAEVRAIATLIALAVNVITI